MAQKITYICDICSKESIEDNTFKDSKNFKGNASLTIEGFNAVEGKGGIEYKKVYKLICFKCANKIRDTIKGLE